MGKKTMVTNDGIFDHFRSARRHHVSGWSRSNHAVRVMVPEPPAERITETDLVNPDLYWTEDAQCVYCNRFSPRMLLVKLTDDPTEDDYADYGCIQAERD